MKTNTRWSLLLLGALSFFTACLDDDDNVNEFSVTYSFDENASGWTGGFSDYPEGEEDFYELDFAHASLPAPLDTTQGALRLTGSNRSDDLFLFAKRQIGGFFPNTEYEIEFDVELATNAPASSIGAGGSPGTSNYVKVGASATEPKQVANEGFYDFNLDKGNQSQSGEDAIVIGNLAHTGDEFEYQLVRRDNSNNTFTATTDNNGNIWVFVGVDSGFEGITSFYITNIKITFR
ncbi:MAG: hypothetical protein ACK4TA_00400 [Saprospiraceae bacterium]